jgi:hypothetical protein
MIKKIILLILCIPFSNCMQKPNIESSINNYDTIKPEIKKDIADLHVNPIFLSLSPRMSDEAFSNEIRKLNIEEKLSDNKFIVNNKNVNYSFNIEKTNNSIRLKYSDEETKSIQNLNYKKSENYLNKYIDRKDILMQIFDSKYELGKIQLPQNIVLNNYGFSKENYKLFVNDNKYIIVGYTILGSKIPNQQEKEIEEKKLKNLNELFYYMAQAENSRELKNHVVFGYEFEINYFHKEDIEQILKSMKKESDEVIKAKNKVAKKEIKRLNNINSNIKEL